MPYPHSSISALLYRPLPNPLIRPIRLSGVSLLCALVVACGGGGGKASTSTSTSTTPTATSLAALVPATTMTWNTQDSGTLTVTVRDAASALASQVAVRVFTASNTDLDGAPLLNPVAMGLLSSGTTNNSGQVTIAWRAPSAVASLLVVATGGTQSTQQLVQLTSASVNVQLQLP
ncbi:MAG: hypothetical protein RIQ60_4153 [Pseudomonadota bacterium]|jgi:hypothetical protein